MNGIIIAAFAGTGKSYLGEKYKNVIDLEPATYKWVYENTDGQLKESEKAKSNTLNPEWPMNYVNKILEEVNNYDIVLIGLNRESRDKLEEMGYKYYLCFPNKNEMDEYLERFVKRGNAPEFIEKQKYYFENELPLLYEEKMEKMILNGNEYLEDYLTKNGYKLVEGANKNE